VGRLTTSDPKRALGASLTAEVLLQSWTCVLALAGFLLACGDDVKRVVSSATLDGGLAGLDGNFQRPSLLPRDGQECNRAELTFASRTPTAYILVDRSSSMFDRGLWAPLKSGVLAIVKQLQADVRFGFASYTGQAGGSCPDLTQVPIARRNYDAIARVYDGVQPPSYKGETPTSLALGEVAAKLAADPETGPKYILLVTDGEPDMCDDGNLTCARDAVVASAQAAFQDGVGTFILSLGGSVDQKHLEDVANAGSGQAVRDRDSAVKYQCQGGLASYGASAGDAPYFEPDVADQAALVATLSSVVARTRSCVFDLTGQVEIDLANAELGDVRIDGARLPFGANGFRMNNPSQLEFLGSACERLRAPQQVDVSIDFPCEAVLYY
jgi:von Willebrand factor type A domain